MSAPTEPRDDSDRLKPCPFCGGDAEWNQHEGDPLKLDDPMTGANWIECLKCGASTNLRYSLMDDCRPVLAEQWNRRYLAAPAQPAPEPAALSNAHIEAWGERHNVNRSTDELRVMVEDAATLKDAA
jgi:Lar family restriction alleviation protein